MDNNKTQELAIEEILDYIASIIAMVRQTLMLPQNAIRAELLKTLRTQMRVAIAGLAEAIERDNKACRES